MTDLQLLALHKQRLVHTIQFRIHLHGHIVIIDTIKAVDGISSHMSACR